MSSSPIVQQFNSGAEPISPKFQLGRPGLSIILLFLLLLIGGIIYVIYLSKKEGDMTMVYIFSVLVSILIIYAIFTGIGVIFS